MAKTAIDLKRLGRYDIESVLGKGAMGVVYAGIDSRLKRKVAIKTILKSALDEDTAKEYSMRFDREARAVARLNHPNIVQVYDFGEEGDIAYIVMEFIKGRELKDFFDANERFEPKEAVHIMGELCDALHFAHEAGIIHRDIKPANVMIDSQGRVKLADFGVARITDASAAEKTQAGVVVGTPAYMSPEQLEGADIDRRTDIFSAGVVLYQFLTGERPFTGSGTWTIAKKILNDDPVPPSSMNSAVSPAFDAVVHKALAKKADERFQTARDLGIALKNAIEGKAESEDSDKTIVGGFAMDSGIQAGSAGAAAAPAAATDAAITTTGTRASAATGTQEVELEFWRSIKDGNDAEDFDLYASQFPSGIYTALAKRKSAKLRGITLEESTTRSLQAQELERREIEEAARREAEVKAKMAQEKAKLEAELAQREADFQKRAAEAEAKREADAKARAEAEAKSKAEFEAGLAKREAEFQSRAAEAEAKREAEAKARAAVEAKSKADFEATVAKREAEAKARAEVEAKAKAEFEATVAKREAELKKREAEAPHKKNTPLIAAGIGLLVVFIGIGVYVAMKPDTSAREAELMKMLDEAKKVNQQLVLDKQREQEMLKEVQQARQREADAKASGDVTKQRELAEQTRQREAEAQKQADLIKAREAEAQKQAQLAKQRQIELKQQAEAGKSAEKDKQREAEQARQAAEKAAAEQRATAEKAAAEKAAGEKIAAEKASAEKASAEKAAAEKVAADKAAAEKLAAQKSAAEKTAAERLATQKAAAEKTNVAAIDPGALLKQGQAAESGGDVRTAVRFYTQAARAGNGEAAKLLGDIFSTGKGEVSRDYAESLRWYKIAENAGVKIERAGRR